MRYVHECMHENFESIKWCLNTLRMHQYFLALSTVHHLNQHPKRYIRDISVIFTPDNVMTSYSLPPWSDTFSVSISLITPGSHQHESWVTCDSAGMLYVQDQGSTKQPCPLLQASARHLSPNWTLHSFDLLWVIGRQWCSQWQHAFCVL